MCGSSSNQNALEAQQATNAAQQNTFMQDYFTQYQTQLGLQSGVLQQIQGQLSPILSAGINQQGFNASELQNLNTQAINQTGSNYANAARAMNTSQAAGTDSTIESGVAQQQQASLASGAAGQLSGEQLQIQQANYATGRQNFMTALGTEQNVASMYNPQSYAGASQAAGNSAINADNSAFQEATTINQENNQWQADLVGLGTAAVGAASGGIGNLDTTGGSSGGEQAMNFLGGMCWIAAKVFGEPVESGMKTQLVRQWMLNHAPTFVISLYKKHGEWASNQPVLVWMLTPVFQWMLKKATQKFGFAFGENYGS